MPLVLKTSTEAKPLQLASAPAKSPPVAGPDRTTALANLPQIMTETETAAYLDMTLKQVTRMRYEKKGPKTFKLGKHWRVRREDLIAWIDEQAAN